MSSTRKDRMSVLFVCTHNSARSQMAEGLLRSMYPNRFDSFSAGVEATSVNQNAVKVMAEIGIDINTHRSKSLREFEGRSFDLVVTVCDDAKESCPVFPNAKRYLHKGFEDPAKAEGSEDQILAVFRHSRDEIMSWIQSTFGPGASPEMLNQPIEFRLHS